MVGRLIEDEEVDWFHEQFYHSQSATLATTQHLYFLFRNLATKHKCTKQVVDLESHFACSHLVDGIKDAQILVKQLCLVLSEIAYLYVVAHFQCAIKRNLVHDTLHESRLTFAILTYKRHLFASLYSKRNVREDGMVAICLAYSIADYRIVATTQTWWKLQVHSRIVYLVDFYRHNLFQLLDAALHLHSLGWLIAESLYEVFDVGNLFLLILVSTNLLLSSLGSEHHILVVFHLIVNSLTTGNLDSAIANIIDESTVVAHQYHSLGALSQELLEPLYTLDIEVVGRLIEQ